MTVLNLIWIALVVLLAADEGLYTAAQADRGKTLYTERCASCHGKMESIAPDMAPLLNDSAFQYKWRSRPLSMLHDRIRDTMPQDAPRTLSPEQTSDLIAYILSANGLPAGDRALPSESAALTDVHVDFGAP